MLKNIFLGAILPLLLVVSGLGVFFGLQSPEPPRSALPQPTPQELLPFMPRAEVGMVRALAEWSDTLNIEISGSVVPYRELQLAAEVAGRIIEKDPKVRSGNYVEKGQVLYRIDPRDYELEVERLTRRRDQELASVEELRQDILNSQRLLGVAEEELELAEAEVERFQALTSSFSSAAELDTARRSRLSSMNQKVTIQNQVRALEADRSRLELAAKLVETELEQAQLNLARTIIRAPVDGRVVSESVEADSYVQRGAQLLVIEDTEKAEVACNIRMDQLYWILDQPNISTDELLNAAQASRYQLPPTPVEIQFEVSGRETITYRWQGVLDRFDGAGLDPQSRTIPIRILVDHPHQFTTSGGPRANLAGSPLLVRGMFVDAVVKARPTTPLLLVPKLSIKPASQSNLIWKFAPNPQALFATPTAQASLAAAEAGESPTASNAESDKGSPLDPNNWETGYLEIVEGVRMVTSYWDNSSGIDYWICEVPSGKLTPGDYVIVTPLPGIKADGSDPVRVDKSGMVNSGTELAGKQQENGQS